MSVEKSTEVTFHRYLPGQQLQFDEAMTEEWSWVLVADAVRRLSQEEELDLKPERLLRMRWVLTWKYTEDGDRKAEARLVILGYQHPELTNVTKPTWKDDSSFVTASMRPAQTSGPFW